MTDTNTDANLTGPESYLDSEEPIVEKSIKVSPDTLSILGLDTRGGTDRGPGEATSHTIHLRDRDLKTHAGVAVCRMTNPVLTVTHMFTPGANAPYLVIAFQYNVTSLGYRSLGGGITQGMQFWNADGGTLWSWGFPGNQMSIRCGDNGRQEAYLIRSTTDVSWFPLWKRCRWTHHQWRVEAC